MAYTRWIGFVLVLGLGLASPALAGGQQVSERVIEDEDYCFRLRRPARAWRLLDEEKVGNVVPDAVAGAVSPRGVYGVVIIEPAAGADLDALAQTLVDGMPLEDRNVFSDEHLEYLGRPARRIGVEGRINDVMARYRLTLFEHMGFAYQVNVFTAALRGRAWEGDFEAFENALGLLDGQPKARNPERTTRDLTGPGWRVKGGTFESAAHALRVAPKAPWSLIVGSELRDLNGDAVIGLQCSAPEAYVIVIAETWGGGPSQAFETFLHRQFLEGMESPASEVKRRVEALGETVEFSVVDANIGIDIRFWYGIRILERTCYQIQAWYPTAQEDLVEKLLEGAIGGIERMEASETRALHAELSRSLATRTRVGPEYALRGGTYRDFAHDFTFTHPKTGYWEIRTGQEAREENADCTITMEELRAGMYGQVICERDLALTPQAFHQVAVNSVWGEGSETATAEPETLELDGITARRHAARFGTGDMELWYELVTVVHRDSSLQLIAWGLLESREQISQAATGMRSGFAFPRGGLKSVDRTPARHTDHRLGFEVALEGLHPPLQDATPAAIRAVGTVLLSARADGVTGYLALCGLTDDQDESFFLDLMEDLMARGSRRWTDVTPKRESVTWRDQDATRLTWERPDSTMRALLVWRDRTLYVVLEAHTNDAARPVRPAADRLTFLD